MKRNECECESDEPTICWGYRNYVMQGGHCDCKCHKEVLEKHYKKPESQVEFEARGFSGGTVEEDNHD